MTVGATAVSVSLSNAGAAALQLSVYSISIAPGGTSIDVAPDHGWYDLTVTLDGHADYARRFAGHLENGEPSVTG